MNARQGVLYLRDRSDSWSRTSTWTTQPDDLSNIEAAWQDASGLATRALDEGCVLEAAGGTKQAARHRLAIRLTLDPGQPPAVLMFLLEGAREETLQQARIRLELVADVPASYQQRRVGKRAHHDVVQLAEALDMMALINRDTRWMRAAITFVNEVATRSRCDRVSLGWLDGDYVRVQAISHLEKFERKMDAVVALESAMEEALDQDEEIVVPRPPGSSSVTRAHEECARKLGTAHLLSLPLRLDGTVVGVLTAERQREAFGESEVRGMRLLCDQATRRLGDLREHDRWFGARLKESLRRGLGTVLGAENTFVKLMTLLVTVLLAIGLFGTWPYRVEGSFSLRTDDLMYLPAPFDGYIDKVEARIGDEVKEDQVLMTLDTRELLLEESAAIADQSRYAREAEKARAREGGVADMQIALALQEQARARLEVVRQRLEDAQIKAPFAGVVVEGDLKKMLGAPVRKGDIVFKVARLDRMYVEIEVDERDIHEVRSGTPGEIAFVSQPKVAFPIQVEEIDPVAIARETGNRFTLRARLTGPIADWWRPGMSGIARIDVEPRRILWIATHRTVDFLRLWLWW